MYVVHMYACISGASPGGGGGGLGPPPPLPTFGGPRNFIKRGKKRCANVCKYSAF